MSKSANKFYIRFRLISRSVAIGGINIKLAGFRLTKKENIINNNLLNFPDIDSSSGIFFKNIISLDFLPAVHS